MSNESNNFRPHRDVFRAKSIDECEVLCLYSERYLDEHPAKDCAPLFFMYEGYRVHCRNHKDPPPGLVVLTCAHWMLFQSIIINTRPLQFGQGLIHLTSQLLMQQALNPQCILGLCFNPVSSLGPSSFVWSLLCVC